MDNLYVDVESHSRVDLTTGKKSSAKLRGPANYFRHPSTDVLCVAYALNDGPVKLWRRGENVPAEFINHEGKYSAHNAEFEHGVFQFILATRYGFPRIPVERWYCTAAKAAYLNLPRSLGPLCERLELGDKSKDAEGHKVMLRLCKPFRGNTIDWENGEFNESPELLEKLYEYCKRDVEAERAIDKLLPDLPTAEREYWLLHQRINERGVPVDVPMCNGAVSIMADAEKAIRHRMAVITDGEVTSPNQSVAMAKFVGSPNVRAETVTALLETDLSEDKREILEGRQALSFAAVKKFTAASTQQVGGRLQGQYIYYGAGPGRWTGTGVQPANFKRLPKKFPYDQVAEAMATGDYDLMELLYGKDVVKIMSQAVRPMVCASPGKKLVGSDLAAIEARGVQWLAGHDMALKQFYDFDNGVGNEPYRIMATQIYGCTFADVDDSKRQVGKVAILGLGYRQGVAKFAVTNGKFGITLEFAQKIVQTYRVVNHPVVKLWKGTEQAALECVSMGHNTSYKKLGFSMWKDFLVMHLPSNRDLFYHRPVIEPGRFGDVITYVIPRAKKGAKKNGKDYRMELHGGVWAENATQAICRDIFCHGLSLTEEHNLPVVLHTYDNIVCEVNKDDDGAVDRLHSCMTDVPSWAVGFPVAASKELDGKRYAK